MSDRIRKYGPVLRRLNQTKNKKIKKEILNVLSEDVDFCRMICELCHNIHSGALTFKQKDVQALRKHKSIIEGVVKRKQSHKKVKNQIGGALLPVLLTLAPLITELFRK